MLLRTVFMFGRNNSFKLSGENLERKGTAVLEQLGEQG